MSDKIWGKLRQTLVNSGAFESEHLSGSVVDAHIGCPAWPNCDLDPQGCLLVTKSPNMYGHQ